MAVERIPMLASLADPDNVKRIISDRIRDGSQATKQELLAEQSRREQLSETPPVEQRTNDPCVDAASLARTHAEQAAAIASSSLDAMALLMATLAQLPGRPLGELTLVPAGDALVGRFTIALGGREGNGRYLEVGQKTIELRAAEADVPTRSYRYRVELPVTAEGLVLAVAIRDEIGCGVSSLRRGVGKP